MDNKMIGLMPKVTGIPFVLWLFRAQPDAEKVRFAVTRQKEWDEAQATFYVIHPTLLRTGGVYISCPDAFPLWIWTVYNEHVVTGYWNREIADGPGAVARLVKIDLDMPGGFTPERRPLLDTAPTARAASRAPAPAPTRPTEAASAG